MRHFILSILFSALMMQSTGLQAQARWNDPGNGNPFIPGYFADPTIRKFGDTYYIYATTDGTGNGYGPAQVWMSRDFVNWRNVVMNWPTTEVVWAPEVIQTDEGKYRYYYCEPCMIHVGESDTPVGPWHNMLGETDAVLMPDRFCHPKAITLDPQVFTDDDGSQYMFVGTWGFYDDAGCGWARLAPDGKSFTDKGLIPSRQIRDFFEAPFLFKHDGKYYFTYSAGSCHDDTYRIQYAVSTTGPTGPYEYKGCILKTNADGTVHGPGHHSILQEGDHYYVVYHRHNNPHSIHGFNRQLCIDELTFDANGDILPITPTHEGLLPASLAGNARKHTAANLAYKAIVTASSYYDDWFRPEYAVDDNNGTLWRAADNMKPAWLQIDLGKPVKFNQVWLQFEYPTFFYQYKVETSGDGTTWTLYSDRTANRDAGSPMIEKGDVRARYVRITITDTQKNGHFPALWNVKIYNAKGKADPSRLLPSMADIDMSAVEAGYPLLHAKDVEETTATDPMTPIIDLRASRGTPLGSIQPEIVGSMYCWPFDGQTSERIPVSMPATMKYNAPYTISAWVYNPTADPTEVVCQFMPSGADLATVEFGVGADRKNGIIRHNASFENMGARQESIAACGHWQLWTVTYDGWMERIYAGRALVAEQNSFLMLQPSDFITIGGTSHGTDRFSGYLHSLQLYGTALTPEQVDSLYRKPQYTTDTMQYDLSGIRLQSEAVTPALVISTLVGKDGQKYKSGSQQFGTTRRPSIDLPEPDGYTVRYPGEGNRLFAYCRFGDLNGRHIRYFVDPVDVSPDRFRHFTVPTDAGGTVRLQSSGKDMNADPADNGDMRYVELTGDFVIQCRVSDIIGSDRHSTPAYNEGGIFILHLNDSGRQSIVHLGVFPNYDCGNMLTVVHRGMRPQYPNQKAWQYDPWMQLQRKGNTIIARTSPDGTEWTEMPGSPVEASFLGDGPLRVGIYQTTYTGNTAWVEFSDIHIWQIK